MSVLDQIELYIRTHPRSLPLLILIACAAALASAYTAQYGFGLEPCILCLYQRIPYAVAGALAIFALVARPGRLPYRLAILAAGLAFVSGASLAFYHNGVEQHWWKAFTACAADPSTSMSLEDLKASIMSKPIKRCDDITWTFLGFSITVYNVLLSLALAVGTFVGLTWMNRSAQQSS